MKNPTPSELTWVSLGGNRGPVHETLIVPLRPSRPFNHSFNESPRYWSDPWGEEEQPRFLNQVIGLDVDLGQQI